MLRITLPILAALVAAVHGCAWSAGEPDPMAGPRAAIGDAACTRDDQCRTIAIGSKACGGPEAYLAWSTQRSDEKTVQAAAETYGVARQAAAAPGGRVSNCLFLADPGARCLPAAAGSGRSCQLLRGSSAPTR